MRNTFLISILLTFYSCASPDSASSRTDDVDSAGQHVIYLHKSVDCNWPNHTVIDTAFTNDVTFKLITKCQEGYTYVDTVSLSEDSLLIRKWRNSAFIITSNLFDKELLFTKESVGDVLSDDLRWNGFLTPPYAISFHQKDTSVVFRTFIGHADSDVGDIYVIKVRPDGRTEVIGVEAPKMP